MLQQVSNIISLCSILIFLACALAFLKDLSTQIAVSDASDIVISQVNTSIAEIMKDEDYTGDYFVNFEKTDISAISSNMARINALSAKILDTVINVTENQTITVEIPIGNLTGVSLLMGRGPKVPVQIIVLTSSKVEFSNSISLFTCNNHLVQRFGYMVRMSGIHNLTFFHVSSFHSYRILPTPELN